MKGASPRELLARLRSLRGTFSRDAEAAKFDALRQLADGLLPRADDVSRFHDELLFLTAFPDSARIHALGDSTLATFAERVERLSAPQRRKLTDTGIAGTVTAHTFMYGVARWLVKHGEQVTLDWGAMEDAERLDALLRFSLTAAEENAFDSGEFSTAEWVELASGRPRAHTLAWLLSGAPERAATLADRTWRGLYDSAGVPMSWAIGASPRSASRNRGVVSGTRVRRAFRALPADVPSHILAPLSGIRRLRGRAAANWHDACVAAIVARAREVSPTIYANHDEIYLAPLGEGAQLCVLGVAPEERMALESNYGYVIFSNGVPVGYGGVTTMSAQANTGANVFESFRHSEAPFLFAETLRAFRTLFGVTRFVVNPYQIGADNDEALATGAYWFYHRLGFRPVQAKVAALANAEYARIRKNRAHRSSLATLRRLASCDLVLELPDCAGTALFDEQWLVTVGRAIADQLAPRAASVRQAYLEVLAGELCERLTGAHRSLRTDERAGAAHLVPVIALVQDEVSAWPSDDRAALWELVRLKGQLREREFARASRAHTRWWAALARLCALA